MTWYCLARVLSCLLYVPACVCIITCVCSHTRAASWSGPHARPTVYEDARGPASDTQLCACMPCMRRHLWHSRRRAREGVVVGGVWWEVCGCGGRCMVLTCDGSGSNQSSTQALAVLALGTVALQYPMQARKGAAALPNASTQGSSSRE